MVLREVYLLQNTGLPQIIHVYLKQWCKLRDKWIIVTCVVNVAVLISNKYTGWPVEGQNIAPKISTCWISYIAKLENQFNFLAEQRIIVALNRDVVKIETGKRTTRIASVCKQNLSVCTCLEVFNCLEICAVKITFMRRDGNVGKDSTSCRRDHCIFFY